MTTALRLVFLHESTVLVFVIGMRITPFKDFFARYFLRLALLFCITM